MTNAPAVGQPGCTHTHTHTHTRCGHPDAHLHACPVLLLLLQVFGIAFEVIKQPVINGYLVAGAVVGPGGLQIIKACCVQAAPAGSNCHVACT